MLKVDDIHAGYGDADVLRDLSLEVKAGETLCIMGRNGAGKSTALKAIMGLVRVRSGRVTLDEMRLDNRPAHDIPRAGIGYAPQGRRLFAELTVAENLEIGLMTRGRGAKTRDKALTLFPRLADRLDQVSGTLSGGEQQMLAIARALCLEPRVLLLDEPTEGLQPSMITTIRDAIVSLKSEGVATILVEQRVDAALSIADRIAFLVNGAIAETLSPQGLAPDAQVFYRYVGV